jgi:malate dehydrogenase
MLRAVLLDEKRMLPCAAYLTGEYGVEGIYAGVPAVLGDGGVERIVELRLDGEEQRHFERSVSSVRDLIAKLDI